MRAFAAWVPLTLIFTTIAFAEGSSPREPYRCHYVEDAPHGVHAWAMSDRIKQGVGTESHFVPYSSESAQTLWRDATTVRDVGSEAPTVDRETSFNMVYSRKGWYIYIRCGEPDLQSLIDRGRDISIELFFMPGMERVPYHQMIISQLERRVRHYDWATPSRDYRSLKGRAVIESLEVEGGIATFIFIPWEALYDRLPLRGETWRFSFMRWGNQSVTWGGKVHETGNFGLITFEAPSEEVANAIRKQLLRTAWFMFQRTAEKATKYWKDDRMGDPVFFERILRPAIEQRRIEGEMAGAPNAWSETALSESVTLTKELMEFEYELQWLRAAYLTDQLFDVTE